jgi:hypothetical protein
MLFALPSHQAGGQSLAWILPPRSPTRVFRHFVCSHHDAVKLLPRYNLPDSTTVYPLAANLHTALPSRTT